VDDAERQGRRDRLRADGLLRGASPRRHARHRDGAQQRRPGDDELPDRQPAGRRRRLRRLGARRRPKKGFDPRKAEKIEERVLQPEEYWQDGDRSRCRTG
jgi:hypothetical protein